MDVVISILVWVSIFANLYQFRRLLKKRREIADSAAKLEQKIRDSVWRSPRIINPDLDISIPPIYLETQRFRLN